MVSNSGMMPTLNNSVLHVSALDFGYPDKKLFSNFTAHFPTGITLVRGGEGRGKSTLLRLLAGALPVKSGQLHLNGVALQSQRESYASKIFWTDPRSDAYDQLSVIDYFQRQSSSYPDFDVALLADMTDGLGLKEHLQKQIFMLSTGSKRKVFLALAFACSAKVTLLDEPFAALDVASIGFMLTRLKATLNANCRVWVIADYVAPDGLPLSQVIDLGD